MKRFGAIMTVTAAVAAFAVPTGASASVTAKQKTVTVEKYAKNVCGVYLKLEDLVSKLGSDLNALPVDDAAAFQGQAVAATNTFLDSVTTAQKKLKKTAPDIDGGKTTAKLFASNIEELRTSVSDALGKFQAADATSPAFVGDVTVFTVSFDTLGATLSDPFSKVDDQDLLGAFKDEKSCKTVVTIYGG